MKHSKVISLYSGAGGLDYGFEAAGFFTSVAVELDADCCNTLRANRPNWSIIQRNILEVSTNEILAAGQLVPGEAAVLIGGPPCQPFSKSGYWATGDAKRLNDPRAATLAEYLRVLEEALPQTFLLENVEGLGFRGKEEGLNYILRGLEEINNRHGTRYSACVRVLNASDYGVPQTRKRLFIVGARDGREFAFPKATHGETPNLTRHTTAWDAIGKMCPDTPADLKIRGKWADLLPSIPAGENYLWHTDRGGGLALFGWRRRFWNFLLKADPNRPVWTLQAQPGPATGPFHWDNRRFSRDELARLQTFPVDVAITGSLSVAHRQLGNAVPSLLAEVLARAIATQFFGAEVATEPTLSVPVRSERHTPAKCMDVPAKYLAMVGEHSPHPGTGLGFGADSRREVVV